MESIWLGMEIIGLTETAEQVLRFLENPNEGYLRAYTSGSTGTPKPIDLPREEVLRSAAATNQFFGIDKNSVLVCPLSADYIAGKMMIVRAWLAGCRLLLLPPSNTPLLNYSGPAISLLPIVPSMTDGLINHLPVDIEHVIVGGAAPTYAQEAVLADAPFHAWATYGMTETCSHVALRDISAHETFFTALPGILFAVDTRGCLVINERFVTNDVVELISPTRFVWLGRSDNVIVSGGLKIYPEQLENLLRPLLPSDTLFYISSRPSELWGRETVIVLCEGKITDAEIMSVAHRALPAKMVPKGVIHSIPEYTASGKLKRKSF